MSSSSSSITRKPNWPAARGRAQVFQAMTATGTDYTLFTLPTGRRCRMTKLIGWNGSTGNAQWTVGYTTAAAVFTQVYPILLAVLNQTNVWTEDELPQFEFTTALGAAIIIRTNIGAATQQVMAEVAWW